MGGLNVLIVEDDLIYAEAVKGLLEREQHTVIGIASDAAGAHALTCARRPDLALVDIGLDDGLSGSEVGRSLALSGVSVLFLTGRSEQAPHGITGSFGVLAKPAGDARLLQAIELVVAAVRRVRPQRRRAEVPNPS